MNAMRKERIDSLDQWRRLELEPIENQEQIINRLAPAQYRSLAQRFNDETFNEITERLAGRIPSEVPGNPSA